jgi:hypothetical protein
MFDMRLGRGDTRWKAEYVARFLLPRCWITHTLFHFLGFYDSDPPRRINSILGGNRPLDPPKHEATALYRNLHALGLGSVPRPRPGPE